MKNNVLAIGIDKYKSDKISQLNNCVNDISNTVDLLCEKYEFEQSDITLLLNEKATQDNIIYSLEDFIAKQNGGENLIIIFSGHGDFDRNLDLGYFVPHEAELYKKNTYIPNSTILNYIKAFDFRHTLLISDSCFSGSIFSNQRNSLNSEERLFEIPSKWALTSGRLEPVDDGVAGKNSPFTTSLISTLKDNQSNLGIVELTNKIIREVANKNTQIPRGAPLQAYGDKGGEFFFKLKSRKSVIIKPVTKLDDELPSSLKEAILEYFDYQEKLENSENENNNATSRRISEELAYIKRAIDRDMIRYFELKKSDSKLLKKISEIAGKDIGKEAEEITQIKVAKQNAVKKQDYLEARKLKDAEELLQENLTKTFEEKKVNFIEIIGNSENEIISDYSIVSLIKDIFSSNLSFENNDEIENLFKDIYFIKLSKDIGKITKYRFEEEFSKYSQKMKSIFDRKPSNRDNIYHYGDLVHLDLPKATGYTGSIHEAKAPEVLGIRSRKKK